MTMVDETIEAILADRFATIPDLASRLDCHFKNVSFAGPFILVGTADRSAARIPCRQVLLRRAAEAVPGAQQVVKAAAVPVAWQEVEAAEAPASQQVVAAEAPASQQEVAAAAPASQQVVVAAAAPASQQEVAASPGAQLQEVVVVLAA